MKILITGSTGIIADSIIRFLINETNHELIFQSRIQDFKPLRPESKYTSYAAEDIKRIKRICLLEKPDVIINTIGLSDISISESDHKLCRELNNNIIEMLSRTANIIEAHFIMFSSEFIFDGSKGPFDEDAVPNPQNYFGKSKLAAENFCKTGTNNFTIIRLPLIYGYSSWGKKDITEKIIDSINDNGCYCCSDNYYTNPMFTDDLARAVEKIIERQKCGVYSFGGSDYISLYEFAAAVAIANGLSPDAVRIQNEATDNKNSAKPEKYGLITLKAQTDLGIKFVSVENGIQTLKYQSSVITKRMFI